MLLGTIAMLTLPLAILGIAGALSYGVKQRSKEIAIRMALGARSQDIERQVIGRAVATTGGALAAGLFLGVGAGRIMRATLFGVAPADPLAIGASIVIVLGVATATALFPARRAGRIDPIEALRHS